MNTNIRNEIVGSLGVSVLDSFFNTVRSSVRDSVGSSVGSSVRNNLWGEMKEYEY